MTPEQIEATLADFQRRLDELKAELEKREQQLARRIDALGDYAGSIRYFANQLQISTDRRLSHLENEESESK